MSQNWNLQDIRPTRKRAKKQTDPEENINNVEMTSPVRKTARVRSSLEENVSTEEYEERRTTLPPQHRPTNKNGLRRRLIIMVASLILIVGVSGWFFTNLLGGVQVDVFPKNREVTINTNVTAYPEKQLDYLNYEILIEEMTAQKEATATGQENVTTQASGQIEISKSTPGAERIVKNTRFQTAEGLVFKVEESVNIPGATTNANGEMVPGTIKANVFAESAGEKYNVPSGTTFNVPGFKEAGLDELYRAVSAKNPSDFEGGFEGAQFIVDDADLEKITTELKNELTTNLEKKVSEAIPVGFIAYPGSETITYTNLPPTEAAGNKVMVNEKAVMKVPIFKEEDLARFLAKETVSDYDGAPVRLEQAKELEFKYLDDEIKTADLETLESIEFALLGKTQLVWLFNEEDFKVDLVGKEKSAIATVSAKYPGIDKAEVIFRPFWRTSFPKERSKISVKEIY